MDGRHFTLWSTLVSMTALGLLFAAAATANPFALLLYYAVMVATIRSISLRSLHAALRVVLLSAFTPPILVLATAFVPRRLDDVAFLSVPITLFFVTYAMVAVVERSLVVNFFVVLLFWLAVSALAVVHQSVASDLVSELLGIALFACAHISIQLGMAAFAEPRGLW